MASFSNGEITVIAAFVSAAISGIVSLITTRYTIKHGPNYQEEIEGLNEKFEAFHETYARTQADILKQQAELAEREETRYQEQERKAEAARWKPTVRIECTVDNQRHINKLILKANDAFKLLEVNILEPKGAKITEVPLKETWVTSGGFSVTIPQEILLKLVQATPTYVYHERFDGTIQYRVERDGKDQAEYIGTIPIHGSWGQIGNVGSFKLNS